MQPCAEAGRSFYFPSDKETQQHVNSRRFSMFACTLQQCVNILTKLGNEHFRQMQITVFFFYFSLTAVSLNSTQKRLLQIPRSLSFAVYVKIHQRKNKICWLHVHWDAPTFKCAHSAGRLCRNCFASASTGTQPHSPPFPEQLCVSLLRLCKSQQMNMSWVHSHKHAELLLQHLSCSLQQRPHTNTKSARSTVQRDRKSVV